MPFENGTFSVTLFTLPQELPEDYIDLLNANRAGSLELVKDEPEIGWASGRCLLDSKIEPSTVLWNNLIYISLRKAERKIPSSMLKAWCQQEELVWMRANGRTSVPSNQKKQIKEEVIEKNLMSIPPTLSSMTRQIACSILVRPPPRKSTFLLNILSKHSTSNRCRSIPSITVKVSLESMPMNCLSLNSPLGRMGKLFPDVIF